MRREGEFEQLVVLLARNVDALKNALVRTRYSLKTESLPFSEDRRLLEILNRLPL